METTQPNELWKLSTTISIVEAALLLMDIEPQGISENIESWADDRKPEGYLAARNAIASAFRKNILKGELEYQTYVNQNGVLEVADGVVDYNASQIDVDSLKEWLNERKFPCLTFPLSIENSPGFRDLKHPRYAHKLAAVAEAWEKYDESEPGTPKQRIAKWLRLNAARFGLTDDDGSPKENVIEDLAKVANWATTGGAPARQNQEEPDPD